jgi:peptidoglycan/LPS O-acetylase OafA/YrhL
VIEGRSTTFDNTSEQARSTAYGMRSCALRRVLRLVPAYHFAILVAIIVWPKDVPVMGMLMHVSFLHALNGERT